ncbi:MAG: hypothetical protein CMB80_04165 [Flammeovirgaceae bacterium]|nr:hypothetical protein [Flammeovirgaceae bacterium]MBE60750.1 hypothetical protein [Flammeovirgaceae bacterium]MBR09997.1 hypothetical protein [Rickettsiales bacterium]|tara:strand:- start:6266 stop:6700 length:435 start_codon:yes stop_codon:yes gene_type:complete
MKITIKTRVNSGLQNVKSGFTEKLFLALNPPFPPVKLLEFGGCETGDIVALRLNFILFKQTWTSEITEDAQTDNEWYFVDQGIKLPFFLKSWTHRHLVRKEVKGSSIIDDISYTTGTLITDLLMYPVLLGQFLYRKPVYKKLFK